eukprot:scaffold37698_cov260-Amphora_coffeaeformis.AAC.1
MTSGGNARKAPEFAFAHDGAHIRSIENGLWYNTLPYHTMLPANCFLHYHTEDKMEWITYCKQSSIIRIRFPYMCTSQQENR